MTSCHATPASQERVTVLREAQTAPTPGVSWLARNRGWAWYTARRLAWITDPDTERRVYDEPLKDELYAYAVERADDVWATWSPTGGAGRTHHMRVGLRWYMYKRARAIRKERSTVLSLEALESRDYTPGVSHSAVPGISDTDEAHVIIARLEDSDKDIIAMRELEGMTFEEMASALGVCRNLARRAYREALHSARVSVGIHVK
jgi:hypothetical protein